MTQECAEYRALYEKMVLPPDVGARVDWARVLEQKQVRWHPGIRAADRWGHSPVPVWRGALLYSLPGLMSGDG